jgi:hypothetical protein
MSDIHNQREIENLQAEIERLRAEIERLRAALTEIRDAGPMALDDQRWRTARAALEGPQDRMAKPLGGKND